LRCYSSAAAATFAPPAPGGMLLFSPHCPSVFALLLLLLYKCRCCVCTVLMWLRWCCWWWWRCWLPDAAAAPVLHMGRPALHRPHRHRAFRRDRSLGNFPLPQGAWPRLRLVVGGPVERAFGVARGSPHAMGCGGGGGGIQTFAHTLDPRGRLTLPRPSPQRFAARLCQPSPSAYPQTTPWAVGVEVASRVLT
jgi:hypothetical protein